MTLTLRFCGLFGRCGTCRLKPFWAQIGPATGPSTGRVRTFKLFEGESSFGFLLSVVGDVRALESGVPSNFVSLCTSLGGKKPG